MRILAVVLTTLAIAAAVKVYVHSGAEPVAFAAKK